MANMRDVARLSGVSIASVSRILNRDTSYKVSKETAAKVFSAATELNYNLDSLRSARTKRNSVACFTNFTAEKHDDSYYGKILMGIKDELAKHCYAVDYQTSQYNTSRDLISFINRDYFMGIIFMTDPGKEILRAVQEKDSRVVCVDTALTQYDNVRYNRFETGCKAMQYLISKGHKKIAFVGSPIPMNFSLQFGRYDAYRTMMRRFHLPVESDWIVDCKWEKQLCYDMTKKLLQSQNRPSAIFFASDHMAIASLSALYDMNIRVPDEISIIGISDIEEAKFLSPALTTIAIPQYDIGRIVANTLISCINGDDTPPKQIYVPTKLIERKSVKEYSQT